MLSYSITWVECIICSKHLALFLDVLTITIILISWADSESKPGDCIKNPQAVPSFLPREHNLEQLAILIQPRYLNSVDLEVHDAWMEARPPSDRQDGGRWLPLLFPEEKLFYFPFCFWQIDFIQITCKALLYSHEKYKSYSQAKPHRPNTQSSQSKL